jgi:hypothetical protein
VTSSVSIPCMIFHYCYNLIVCGVYTTHHLCTANNKQSKHQSMLFHAFHLHAWQRTTYLERVRWVGGWQGAGVPEWLGSTWLGGVWITESGWMDGSIIGISIHGYTNAWVSGWMDVWVGGCVDECGWVGGWMCEWVPCWVHEWVGW